MAWPYSLRHFGLRAKANRINEVQRQAKAIYVAQSARILAKHFDATSIEEYKKCEIYSILETSQPRDKSVVLAHDGDQVASAGKGWEGRSR